MSSDRTVIRRRRELGLKCSGALTKELPEDFKRQLVLDQMRKDPSGAKGPRSVKLGIYKDTGIQLTRCVGPVFVGGHGVLMGGKGLDCERDEDAGSRGILPARAEA
jgi:hypothetical protein